MLCARSRCRPPPNAPSRAHAAGRFTTASVEAFLVRAAAGRLSPADGMPVTANRTSRMS